MLARRRLAVLLLLGIALVGLTTSPAAAHVTVQPPEATQGGYAKLTFRVPNERPNASTVGLRVSFPSDAPFTSVSVKPKAGWTYEVTETALAEPVASEGEPITEAVSEVAWSGGTIAPGEFEEFEVSVGPLPEDEDQLVFPAIQLYDNGEEVAWIEQPTVDGTEPERPAPTLELIAATGEDGAHGGAATAAAAESDASEQAAATNDSGDDNDGLAIAAVVVSGIAIVLSIFALARRRTEATS